MADRIDHARPLLSVRGMEKHFGAVRALNGIDLDIPRGQVTALVGDNGAGKSVLIKCMAGIYEPDAGEITWEGKPVRIRNPRDAAALGIEVVYQDLALCDNLDVVQNMFLGREVIAAGLLDEDSMERSACKTLSDLRVTTLQSVREPVASLSGGQRQSIAVAKAVMWNSKLVILDEPTAALGVAQTRQVLDLVRRLAGRGLAVIMISHNLNDVFSVADRLAVLRLGKLVAVGDAARFDPQMAVELMTLGQTSRTPDRGSRLAAEETYDRGGRVGETSEETSAVSARPAATGKPAEAAPVRGSSLWGYFRAQWAGVLAGRSGVLPVVTGTVLIAAVFQSQNPNFLTPGNLVNLLVQASVFMLIGMGEAFVLLLAETDLSLGFVAGIAGTIVTILAQPETGWPWWAAVPVALIAASLLGLMQGTLVSRFRLPSFVVTLAGLLGFQGVMIQLLGAGGTIPIPDETINNFANGTLNPMAGWIVTAVVIVVYAAFVLRRDVQRRQGGLVAPPRGLTALKIALAAVAGMAIILLTSVDRGVPSFPVNGMPWVVPIVFTVLVAWSQLLGRTRFGRYVYAIGGNPEATRRAGIDLARIRTFAFMLAAFTAGIGGIVYASRLRSMSTSFDGGTIVLYVVASAVIGGTSMFGGRGHPLHPVLGGIVIAAIVNGMALLGLPAAIQLMATAVVLIVSVMVDVSVRRRGETTR
jgi:D-xylose transport system permease protein/D-xylose transport system ATP-binding protein